MSKNKLKGKKTLMGQRELARFLQCSLGKVQHHFKSGTIYYEEGTKLFDPEVSRQRIEELNREKLDSEAQNNSKRLDYQQARMLSTLYEAKLKKLDYEKKAGKLVDADQVKKEQFKLARMVRDRILNIPNRISDQLSALTDSHAIHLFLTKEITDALQDLVDDGKQRSNDGKQSVIQG